MRIQASFNVFCHLLLQLDPNFNIQALECLVTVKAVDAAIAEAEDELVVGQEGVVEARAIGEKEAVQGVIVKGTFDVVSVDTKAMEMLEREDAS